MTDVKPLPAPKSRISSFALVSAAAVFLLSRIVYLDQDIPAYSFVFYAPTDEPYYTISAFNLLRYGTWTHKVFDFLPPDELPVNAVQNLLTYFGLLAFGNNFFGLRMSAVACGFLVFAGTLWCLHKTPRTDDQGWTRLVVGLAAVYMIGDFFFLQSNRINDPTTFMMAATVACMIAVVAIDIRMPRSLIGSLLLGLLAGSVIVFVYLHMVYVAAALGVTVFFDRWRNDTSRIFLHALAFVGGGIVAALLYTAFTLFCFHLDPLEVFTRVFNIAGERGDFARSNIVEFVRRNAANAVQENLSHNLFFYNPALLFTYLAAMPIFVLKLVRERRAIDIFVAACLAFRILLSAVMPFDYHEKKLIQLFPLVIYVIGVAAIACPPPTWKLSIAKVGWLGSYIAFLIALAILLNQTTQTRLPVSNVRNDLMSHTEMWIALPLLALIVLSRGRLKKIAACILIGVILLPGIRFDRKYLFAAPTFQYRDSLIRAAPKLNGKTLAGGFSYTMRLYNTSTPMMNHYAYYYYGYDKFATYSRYLFDHKLVDGTILYLPFHSVPILKPIYDYANSGGLILNEVFDVNDVEQKYKIAIYSVPGAAANQPSE